MWAGDRKQGINKCWPNTQHHFLAARNHKEDRYDSLLPDLQHAGFLVDLVTVEVGHFMPLTLPTLSNVAMSSTKQYNTLYTSADSSCCHLLFAQYI